MCDSDERPDGSASMRDRLLALGYSSVIDYLEKHPEEPYSGHLASRLGVLPVVLVRLHLTEADSSNLREVARDVLVRLFAKTHQRLDGNSNNFGAILATLSGWESLLKNSVPRELRIFIPADLTVRLSREIERIANPGWATGKSPVGILTRAFDKVWV